MRFLPSRLPLILAPMVGSFSPLTIAVSAAGGLGSLACAALQPAQLREEIARIRSATAAPFNLNFFCHVPPQSDIQVLERWEASLLHYYAEAGLDTSAVQSGGGRAPFDAAMCEVVEEARPAVVSFHFGLPDEALLARVKATGATVLSSATTVEEARWLEAHGVDAIVAQGAEAGGHRGMFLTKDIGAQPALFALLPQVVDAVHARAGTDECARP
jgi:nitronate monooxygenase